MKRLSFFLLLFLFFFSALPLLAQSESPIIETLNVDLWPDYDKEAVLVLLTGTLSEDTSLPATVTLPLPETAEFNVVARIDPSDGLMKDDIEFTTGSGKVTFTTPAPRFRVEYYFPYAATDGERTFIFSWLAEVTVNQLQVNVQQPLAATSLLTNPTSENVITGEDGFTYYVLPSQNIPEGQPFSVQVDYRMTQSQLSVESGGPSIADARTTGFSPESSTAATPTIVSELDWPIVVAAVAGIVLIVAAVTWQIASTRATARPRKPRPVRAAKSTAQAQYCHICGQPLQAGDKFCRECGTATKGG